VQPPRPWPDSQVPHLHVHLLPPYPGTPREYWWDRVDEWPDAPPGDATEVEELVGAFERL
jgi:histidine triad (HIT) family protein